jgi:triacylglycerol esterase/lipase EstA (alpha/beta hydrolase family)
VHLSAFWGELVTAIKVFNWWQPFRRAAIADGLDVASLASGQRGVVLVHGFFCNRAFWTHWMRRLQAQQRPFIALDLEPPFGSIDDYCATLDRAVRQMRGLTGRAPVLVGHSMGGLAIRAWWAGMQRDPPTHAPPNPGVARDETHGPSLAHCIVTIGTPHQGTWLARYSLTANGGQMRQGSRWLTALESNEKTANSVEYICFYSNCDNIVFPVSSAKLQGADNRLIRGRGHIDMASDPALLDACWSLMQ